MNFSALTIVFARCNVVVVDLLELFPEDSTAIRTISTNIAIPMVSHCFGLIGIDGCESEFSFAVTGGSDASIIGTLLRLVGELLTGRYFRQLGHINTSRFKTAVNEYPQ